MNSTDQPLVMVVDDTPEDLYISNRLITKFGGISQVIQFNMATDALEYLKTNIESNGPLPGVIFLDIHMPRMTGFEFMEQYDQLPENFRNGCRVYVLSSSFDQRDIDRANSNPNVSSFCEKPLSKDVLAKIFPPQI